MKWVGLICGLLFALGASAQTPSPQAAACAQCHSQARSQPATSMGRALELVEFCKVLVDHPLLTTTLGKYSYRIERQGNQSNYSVTDGTQTVTMPIRWAMGASSAIGQTYILEKDGQLYESRVSFFRELQGLGPTLGSAGSMPADINDAAGRLMSQDDKLKCFGCHATEAAHGLELTLEKLQPGVTCNHCHSDVALHMASALENDSQPAPAKTNLPSHSAEDTANFCGQCHRTWADIAMQPNPSIANVRFQPYRLTGSKCFDADDPRIGCLACHDPHKEVQTNPSDYDAQCKACHSAGGKPGAKRCSVANDKCVTCHMPKLDLPGAHFKFSDHRIRIVKPNVPYPG